MTANLPAHVGRDITNETGYALVCSRESATGALCGEPATWHVIWTDDGENSLVCPGHLDDSKTFGPVQIHTTANGACSMPGSIWLRYEERCVMEALEEEPARERRQEMPA
jgi:hypothetical protein